MLKRQRPSSPPPSASNVPLISDLPLDYADRPSKRSRTKPPSLNGAERGWATTADDEEDDGEEDVYDELPSSTAPYAMSTSMPPEPHITHYKSTNDLLRELHVLNQHRLVFSTPTSSCHTGLDSHTSSEQKDQYSVAYMPLAQIGAQVSYQTHGSKQDDAGQVWEEAQLVQDRYEAHNRYVTCAFRAVRSLNLSPDCLHHYSYLGDDSWTALILPKLRSSSTSSSAPLPYPAFLVILASPAPLAT